MALKVATIVACTVEVLCPHCGEGQPNPDNGGFPWTPEELRSKDGNERVCVSCDKAFRILNQTRVSNQ